MEHSTILHNLSAEQITNLFKGLQHQIDELKDSFEPKTPTEYLTRKEVAEILKCDISTVNNWCNKGKLVKNCIGNRVYIKRSELEAAIKPI